MFGLFGNKKTDTDTMINKIHKYSERYVESVLASNNKYKKEDFDYSEKSLELVDDLLQRYNDAGSELTSKEQLYCSAYVMECARKEFGGSYKSWNKINPYILVIANIGFEIGFCAMDKIRARVKNGREDNLMFFYKAIRPHYNRQDTVTIV